MRSTTSCRPFSPDEQARLDELLDAAADAVEAWARDGHHEGRQSLQHVRAATGRRRAAGRAGRDRRTTRRRRRPPDEDRLAQATPSRPGAGTSELNERPPLPRQARRRATTRRAHLDRVRRAQGPTLDATALDFDVAAVDAEVDDAPRAKPPRSAKARGRARRRDEGRRRALGRGGSPDLSVLPPLLVATGLVRLAPGADRARPPRRSRSAAGTSA